MASSDMQQRTDGDQVSDTPPVPWTLGLGRDQLLSYVIPTFNAGQYIEETLESCFTQDYRPLEIVIVDDGSTDHTREIVEKFKKRREDDEFRILYIHQQNAGVNAARNNGLRASHGEYIGLLDADDLLPRRRTSLLHHFLVTNDADLVYGPCVRFTHSHEVLEYLRHDDSAPAATAEPASCDPPVKWIPNVWSFVMTRSFADRVGPFSESVRTCCPDIDYTIRVRLCRPRMYRTAAIVNLYRAVPGSMASKNRPEAIRDWMLSMRLITELLRERGLADAESQKWIRTGYFQVAVWALRLRLKAQAVDAFERAGDFSSGLHRIAACVLACACQTPLVVPLLSFSIQFRSRVWVPVRNKLLSFRTPGRPRPRWPASPLPRTTPR